MDKFIIQWHITSYCNLRCLHCYQDDYQHNISMEEFRIVLDKLEQYCKNKNFVPQINLTGGEPLIHPDFMQFAREIVARGFKLAVLTNGTMIDCSVAHQLALLKPLFVQVSLDGIKDTHDKIRGPGNFDKALRGIDALKSNKIRTMVSFTAQKCNYKEFADVARVCKEHKVDKLWWDRVVTNDPEQYLSTDEFQEIVNTCNSLVHYRKLFNPFDFVSNQRSMQCFGTEDCGYQCTAGKSLLVILPDGAVMPCRRLPLVVGNLIDGTMSSIYSNPTMKSLREYTAPRACLGCKEYERCRGGAKCVTFAQTGQWDRIDVNCLMQD